MNRPQLVWTGRREPTRAELQAIGRAWRAGLIPDGARVGCAIGNPEATLADMRHRVRLLSHELQQARETARGRAARVRERRDAARPKLSARIGRLRGESRERMNARAAELRELFRSVWNARLAQARAPVLKAEAALEAQRAHMRDERRWRKGQRPSGAGRRGAVARQESDERVHNNIDPDLWPVWERMKHRLRTAGSRATRTEAFLEWVSENRREVDRMLADEAEAAQDDLEAELQAQEAAYYQESAA